MKKIILKHIIYNLYICIGKAALIINTSELYVLNP